MDSAVTLDGFERAEAPTVFQAPCRDRIRRLNIGLCAVVIVTMSLLGWAVIVWPLVGLLR
jgi:hypothetical protein